MSLSANHSVGLWKLFGPSAPKRGPISVRSRQLSKLPSSLHAALDLKNLLKSLNTLLCG